MDSTNVNILLIETDPEKINIFIDQTFEPLGYKVKVLNDVATAINTIAKDEPDLVLVDVNLEGLSANDLLVAIKSQNMEIPVIIVAEQGQESLVIQAFRLGGTDYLTWPAKETEIVACVERSLIHLQENREGQQLSEKLKQANRKLETSMNGMSTIIGVSKAIVSITDQKQLFAKIVEGLVKLANADYGWMTLKNEKTNEQILVSQYNLPDVWTKKIGHPMDDGIGSLVELSGESLSINGTALEKFKVHSLGRSVTVVPIKVKKDVIGLLGQIKKRDEGESETSITLAETLADFAAISIVNAHLFQALQDSIEKGKKSEKEKGEKIGEISKSIKNHFLSMLYPVELMLSGKMGEFTPEQKETLENIHSLLDKGLKEYK